MPELRFMSIILPRPSVSPLHSFVSVPTISHRAVSFSAALRLIVRWMTGRQPESSARDRQLEAAVVQKLIEELPDEPEPIIPTEQPRPTT
jgi:hypothetical protein